MELGKNLERKIPAMSQSMPDNDFINQLDGLVRDFVKEQLETIMKE